MSLTKDTAVLIRDDEKYTVSIDVETNTVYGNLETTGGKLTSHNKGASDSLMAAMKRGKKVVKELKADGWVPIKEDFKKAARDMVEDVKESMGVSAETSVEEEKEPESEIPLEERVAALGPAELIKVLNRDTKKVRKKRTVNPQALAFLKRQQAREHAGA